MNGELRKDLVSLIVPYYNAEEYIGRLLDSVLEQTYKRIQLILVNDGSDDRSAEIVEEYAPALERELFQLVRLEQPNGGAGSAVNHALKYVDGEYLAWADSDDILTPDNIALKYRYLASHGDAGLVMGRGIAVDYETGRGLYLLEHHEEDAERPLFESMIFGGFCGCYPGVFMLRTALLFERLREERTIFFDSRVGQSWQLVLPVACGHRCGYLPDYIYLYRVRKDSHSRGMDDRKLLEQTYAGERSLTEIFWFLEDEERGALLRRIHIHYLKIRTELWYRLGERKDFFCGYHELKAAHAEPGRRVRLKAAVMRVCPGFYRLRRKYGRRKRG